MVNTHLAYSGMVFNKVSGTDPDQSAESFAQLIGRKVSFPLGDAPAHPDDLASYTFQKKHYFPFYFKDMQQSEMKIIMKRLTRGHLLAMSSYYTFLMDGTDSDTKWK